MYSSIVMNFKLVAILSGVAAIACLLILPICIIAIPGVENEYARAWRIVVSVIASYPQSIFLLYGSNLIVWLLFLNDKLSSINLMRWQQISTVLAIAFAVVAILQTIRGFRIMIGK